MPDLFVPTLADQITEVRREIGLRERVYPIWVRRGELSQAKAGRQIRNMQAVLNTLLHLSKQETKSGESAG